MNENIDLTQILKDCPKGTKFYSTVLGEVTFKDIVDDAKFPIIVSYKCGLYEESFMADGRMLDYVGECTLFPSKDQRDWSKFTAPWYKPEKKKFDPKTLKPFDKVIVKGPDSKWLCGTFSHYDKEKFMPYICIGWFYDICIPYNDDTKHLLGTTDEAPEYYRYWED